MDPVERERTASAALGELTIATVSARGDLAERLIYR